LRGFKLLHRRVIREIAARFAGQPFRMKPAERGRKMVETLTPRALFDLYVLLTDDNKREFLRLLAGVATADTAFGIAGALDLPEQKRFTDMVFDSLTARFFPVLLAEARKLARLHPDISDQEFEDKLASAVGQATEEHKRTILARESEVV
jgi:hypothetical protein